MKLIGLLGGMSWETSAIYYRMINEMVRRERGHNHAARLLMHSVDFNEIDLCRRRDDWDQIGRILGQAGRSLQAGGADFIVMASNTMHQIADHVRSFSGLDLLHIADPTGFEIRKDGFEKVAMLGTRYTMESQFYPELLANRYGIEVITPECEERAEVNRIIYEELSHGVVRTESRIYVANLIGRLHERGAQALVLACSEITMIVPPDHDIIPVYDTTRLHVRAAVQRSMKDLNHV